MIIKDKVMHLIALCLIIISCSWHHAAAAATETDTRTKIVEEEEEIGYIQTIVVDPAPIASVQSPYQKIDVHTSDHFGKVLVIDDCLQLTEKDAPHYNEMLGEL